MHILRLDEFLNKFEENFTTIDVFETSKNDYFMFTIFDIVPVRCDISYIWNGDTGVVEDSFCVDRISMDSSDNTVTFELAERTKEMVAVDDIISLKVSKISEREYLQAIKDEEDALRFLEYLD